MMILYKAIKYYILDYCIGVLTSGILNNIHKRINISCKDITIGMEFSVITHKNYTFKNCTITKIYRTSVREDSADFRFRFRQHNDEWNTSIKGNDTDTKFYI